MKIYIAAPITNNPGYEKQFAEPQTFSESDVFKSIVMGFFGM